MQPVQDLTVEDRVSRTQYQYSLEVGGSEGSGDLGAAAGAKLQADCRICATWPPTSRTTGWKRIWWWTAIRLRGLGLTPQAIDDTLYDAFGQRQVSTMFTQLNQYHVVLEVEPEFRQNPDALKNLYVKSQSGTQVPLSAFTHFEPQTASLAVNHQGQFPAVTISFNLAPGASLGDGGDAD